MKPIKGILGILLKMLGKLLIILIKVVSSLFELILNNYKSIFKFFWYIGILLTIGYFYFSNHGYDIPLGIFGMTERNLLFLVLILLLIFPLFIGVDVTTNWFSFNKREKDIKQNVSKVVSKYDRNKIIDEGVDD